MGEKRDYKAEVEVLQRRLEVQHEAIQNLEAENRKLIEQVLKLTKINASLEQNLFINKNIMRDALERQNELKDAHTAEIRELEEKLKAFNTEGG